MRSDSAGNQLHSGVLPMVKRVMLTDMFSATRFSYHRINAESIKTTGFCLFIISHG